MVKKQVMKENTDDQDIYIYNFLETHIKYCENIQKINTSIDGIKKIRQPVFPETLSEYIAKSVYGLKYNKCVKFGNSCDFSMW
jgi:hypothetical protein